MPKTARKSFTAVLETMPSRLRWVIIRVPFDVARVWGARGQVKIQGEVNGFPFRTSLFPTGAGEHYLLVNKRMQAAANIAPGSAARFTMEPDTLVRTVTIPIELKRFLGEDRGLQRWFQQLSYSMRKYIGDWVSEPKGAQARARRAEQIGERLLETMEAELELPSMLRLAFERNRRASAGWQRMTPLQRRTELLAIFYYRNPESRARRMAQTIARAEDVAGKLAAAS